jgi:hypothetical protein
MQIKIKKNAHLFTKSSKMKRWLIANEGQWIEVETVVLFTNQYLTAEYRIWDPMVEAVRDDARINKGECRCCGTIVNRGEICSKYKACPDYGIEWFTPENTFFLKYPNGIKQPAREILSTHPDAIKVGTYYVENLPAIDCYRIYNRRQTIDFKYDKEFFYILYETCYKQVKHLLIPEKTEKALKIELNKLIDEN